MILNSSCLNDSKMVEKIFSNLITELENETNARNFETFERGIQSLKNASKEKFEMLFQIIEMMKMLSENPKIKEALKALGICMDTKRFVLGLESWLPGVIGGVVKYGDEGFNFFKGATPKIITGAGVAVLGSGFAIYDICKLVKTWKAGDKCPMGDKVRSIVWELENNLNWKQQQDDNNITAELKFNDSIDVFYKNNYLAFKSNTNEIGLPLIQGYKPQMNCWVQLFEDISQGTLETKHKVIRWHETTCGKEAEDILSIFWRFFESIDDSKYLNLYLDDSSGSIFK